MAKLEGQNTTVNLPRLRSGLSSHDLGRHNSSSRSLFGLKF
jgi:hypothetical protein